MSWRGLDRSRCTSSRLLACPAFRYRVAVCEDHIRRRLPGSFCLAGVASDPVSVPVTLHVLRTSRGAHKPFGEWVFDNFAHPQDVHRGVPDSALLSGVLHTPVHKVVDGAGCRRAVTNDEAPAVPAALASAPTPSRGRTDEAHDDLPPARRSQPPRRPTRPRMLRRSSCWAIVVWPLTRRTNRSHIPGR
jgi:hypothetical protein